MRDCPTKLALEIGLTWVNKCSIYWCRTIVNRKKLTRTNFTVMIHSCFRLASLFLVQLMSDVFSFTLWYEYKFFVLFSSLHTYKWCVLAMGTSPMFLCQPCSEHMCCFLLPSLLYYVQFARSLVLTSMSSLVLNSMTTNKFFFSPPCNDNKWGVLLSLLLCTSELLF